MTDIERCIICRGVLVVMENPFSEFHESIVGCEKCLKKADQQAEPIHDIGWAVKQLKEGKKVRHSCNKSTYWAFDGSDIFTNDCDEGVETIYPDVADLLATDWEIYDEVKNNHTSAERTLDGSI